MTLGKTMEKKIQMLNICMTLREPAEKMWGNISDNDNHMKAVMMAIIMVMTLTMTMTSLREEHSPTAPWSHLPMKMQPIPISNTRF